MQLWRTQRWWLVTLVVSALFVFLRLYRIETSLLFFNDIGRDFLELWKWQQTGKPPLLGPQTSALPFNQSAVYFYVLMPLYVFLRGSLVATIYTNLLTYLVLIWLGVLWLRQKNHQLLPVFWTLVALFAVQPEMVIQHRFVWNPSFVTAWLMITICMSWQMLATPLSKWHWGWFWIWGFGLALALSFSYSAMPAVVAGLILAIIWWRKSAFKLWLTTAVSGIFLNFPTVLFELRHEFLLTKMMLFGPWIKQTPSTLLSRYQDIWHYILGSHSPESHFVWLLWGGLVVIFVGLQIRRWNQSRYVLERAPLFLWCASWWLLTLLLTLVLPVAVQSHYIFPVLTLGLTSLVLLPHKLKWGVLGVLVIMWLQPHQLKSYWKPARHSLAELTACSTQICASVSEPLFVSNQASAHPYHNAMEYQYLLRKAGCNLQDLANFPDSAQVMAVILDDSVYEHGKTSFNELTLFGKSQEEKRLYCQPNLAVVFLRKTQ